MALLAVGRAIALDVVSARSSWQRMVRSWPSYDEYAQKTDREIPVVVLERI